ncbi:MAG: sensor histidine kinase [Ruminococcaceae bacterium]|nr:sensor histidine kinase [Oscillospiraceae bacterium]
MFKSVFSKYLLVISLVVIFGFLSMTLLQIFLTADALAEEKESLLSENVQNVAGQAERFMFTSVGMDGRPEYMVRKEQLSLLLNGVAEAIDATFVVTDSNGLVLVVSEELYSTPVRQYDSLEAVIPKVKNGYYEVGRLGGVYSTRHYTAAAPLRNQFGEVLGYVFASAPADALSETVKDNIRIYAISVLVALSLCLIVVWWMADRFVRPLRRMAEATRRFAEGDFSVRVKVKGKDEVAELGEALNSMAVSLSSVEMMRRSFIANVSHELKTPMTTIAGFLDGMMDGTIPPEKQAYYMKIVSDEVKRLSRLVHSMLDLSRIDSGELKMNRVRLDLTEVVCSVLVASEQRIEQKRLTITGLEECDRLEVEGDYDLLNQVLYNLVDNAIKFTNEGGSIDLRLQRVDNRAQVVIRNTGAGIPADEMPRIFERFYKSDRSRSLDKNGVGLGLYIVHTVVRLHGGEVAVRSVEGEFTEFSFWVPLK